MEEHCSESNASREKGGTRASGRVLAHFLRNVCASSFPFYEGAAKIRQDVLLCWRFFFSFPSLGDDVLAPSWLEIEGGNGVHVLPG